MDTITYTSARGNLAKTMKKVCDGHAPVVAISRKSSKPVVMMSLEDFQALKDIIVRHNGIFTGAGCLASCEKWGKRFNALTI